MLFTHSKRILVFKYSTVFRAKHTLYSLENTTAVITGGAGGIGCEIAKNILNREGKVVILLDTNEKDGKKAEVLLNSKYGDAKAIFIKCDVTKDIECVSKEIIEQYKPVNLLVNTAGILNEQWPRKVIGTNLTALIEWSLKFWNHMRTDTGGEGGTIMNLSSTLGFRINGYVPVYQASMFGVMGFTKSLGQAHNFKRTGVRVVSINPGITDNNLISKIITLPENQDYFLEFVKCQPSQKVKFVGIAAMDVFERAESGTAWLIEGSNPIAEIKHCMNEIEHCK